MPWRRHRRTASVLDAHAQATAWQICSLLLEYPQQQLWDQLELLAVEAGELPDQVGTPLIRFIGRLADGSLQQWQTEYVDTFDVTRRCALHLTYFLHGDTRNRGAAMVQIKQAFRRSGVVLTDEDAELPDHLAVLLEFGATVDAAAAWKILNDHRVGVELLRRALSERSSAWLDVVQAVRATLPKLDDDDEIALQKLIAEGPPTEEVGIDSTPYTLDPAVAAAHHPGPVSLGQTIEVGVR
ncbi:MAG: nitrate reductase molybdenum cofactor assembly chaperone [Beutenbergiaceae bacterium]